MLDDVDLLVVGAGPVGCLVAERAASILGWRVLVVDRRSHIAGNCHDAPHANGVLIHRYGPHYFRCRHQGLLDYLGQFTEWIPATYEVRSLVRGRLYPFPINLTTLEMFFGRRLDADSAEALLAEQREPIATPRNSEELVLSRVGRKLYEAFYQGYTRKQWGLPASKLEPGVCGRIPVRLDRRTSYVDDPHQMMPAHGFTALFARMIDHPRIRVLTGCDFAEVRHLIQPRRATLYTGPIDAYFGHRLGPLPYRSLQFDFMPARTEFFQPCVQINYPNDHPWTRTVEIKHVTGQKHPETVVSFETPRATGEPYYPVPAPANRLLYERYRLLAEEETRTRQVYFCGRLAQYRYFNTDEALLEALACFEQIRRRHAPSASSQPALAA
ncbi:MAG: UDP-galactopyranose mutase [Gemmataceae bacterium]